MHVYPSIYGALLASACAIALAACGGESAAPSAVQEPASPVLFKVGDTLITAADLAEEVELRERSHRAVPEKEQLLAEMVERLQLVERARQVGIQDDPEIGRRYQNMLIGALRERQLSERVRAVMVSEEDLRTAYESDLENYRVPAKVRLAWIRLEAGANLDDDARAELRSRIGEARKQHLDAPAPDGRGLAARGFGSLAIKYSDDQPTRYRGGELGWIEVGRTDYRWPEPVISAGAALEADGMVSEIIELPEAFCLVMRSGFVEAKTTPFESVSAAIRNRLIAERRSAIEEDFAAETVKLIPVERFPDAIADIAIEPNTARAATAAISPPAVPGS